MIPLKVKNENNEYILSTITYPSKSWTDRTFGKLRAGSVRSSIFTLASTAMGAGYLGTPKILKDSGVVLGSVIIILSGFLIYLSLLIVALCADEYKIYHYPSVAKKILGNKWSVLLEIAIIFNGYGMIVALNIIIGSLVPNLLSSFNLTGGDLERALIMVCLNVAVVTPLSIMRNLSALRFKALFNVLCVTFIMSVVIFELPYFVKQNNYNDTKYFVVDINIFGAFSNSLFAYLCHQNITRIQGELFNPTMERMKKVTRRSLWIMTILFFSLAMFGYLSCLNDTPDLIILRDRPKDISNDAAMVVCRVLVTFTMSIAIPINLNPCRVSIQKLVFKTEGKASNVMHYGITLGIILTSLILAIFLPDIKIVFNFLGGFCGGVMALIIPGLMYIKHKDLPITSMKSLAVISVTWGLAAVGFTSIIIDIYDAAN
jgi:solute carrier family 36 (proton-coupled amino acid transporter)